MVWQEDDRVNRGSRRGDLGRCARASRPEMLPPASAAQGPYPGRPPLRPPGPAVLRVPGLLRAERGRWTAGAAMRDATARDRPARGAAIAVQALEHRLLGLERHLLLRCALRDRLPLRSAPEPSPATATRDAADELLEREPLRVGPSWRWRWRRRCVAVPCDQSRLGLHLLDDEVDDQAVAAPPVGEGVGGSAAGVVALLVPAIIGTPDAALDSARHPSLEDGRIPGREPEEAAHRLAQRQPAIAPCRMREPLGRCQRDADGFQRRPRAIPPTAIRRRLQVGSWLRHHSCHHASSVPWWPAARATVARALPSLRCACPLRIPVRSLASPVP